MTYTRRQWDQWGTQGCKLYCWRLRLFHENGWLLCLTKQGTQPGWPDHSLNLTDIGRWLKQQGIRIWWKARRLLMVKLTLKIVILNEYRSWSTPTQIHPNELIAIAIRRVHSEPILSYTGPLKREPTITAMVRMLTEKYHNLCNDV